ncbi:hypothetical protein G6L37_00530 [Agrobacterium rubi]|nr:hypothetical protein [Agrobacterium rubi]NTF23875.1 hypothetical protein [Agrobacterium rubi]
MTDALAIAADYEVDNDNLVGVNDYSMGHEAGQMFAAERIADLIRYHEAESPAVALLRRIRTEQPYCVFVDEIDEVLEALSARSEECPNPMSFTRAMFHARENAGEGIGVRRPGQTWFVVYDATITSCGEFGWVREQDDGRIARFSPGIDDMVSMLWAPYVTAPRVSE